MTKTREQITTTINLFVHLLQLEYDKYFAEKYKTLTPPKITVNYGSKNAKIVLCEKREDGEYRPSSVYCFIDLSNGDIYKAAGWQAPAKGARGNIFNEDCDVGTKATVNGGGLYR